MDAGLWDLITGVGSESSDDSDQNSLSDDNIDGIDGIDTDYDAGMQNAIDELEALDVPVNAPLRREMIEVYEFDPKHNVMNLAIREEFKTEKIFNETEIFTEPVSTTNTMEGYLSNVQFHEEELIGEFEPDVDIVIYRCNYGKLKYAGYTEPVKQRTTNRGRKKKIKKKKLRKKQGEGGDFNSQITFVARSQLTPVPVNGIIPLNTRVYKFKVFRTGKLQLPGVHQHLIDDVINCTKTIVGVLNQHLHAGELNPALLTNIININPVMKNYKFTVKLPAGHIIDLEALRKIMTTHRAAQFRNDLLGAPEHPKMFRITYTRQDTKLSVKFITPIHRKPKKMTRVNIFMRGKINILGAFEAATTRQICEFLHWLFETCPEIIVPEGVQKVVLPPLIDNIADISAEFASDNIDAIINWLPDLPLLTDNDSKNIGDLVGEIYDYNRRWVSDYLTEWVAELGHYLW
jgi:hypothetical protein